MKRAMLTCFFVVPLTNRQFDNIQIIKLMLCEFAHAFRKLCDSHHKMINYIVLNDLTNPPTHTFSEFDSRVTALSEQEYPF